MTRSTAAERVLDAASNCGISYIFGNLGTDHVSIIEGLAAGRERGSDLPRMIIAPHENVAVHMAGGYALATGAGQMVLVHVDAGTANAALAMHNLFRTRVPVMLVAGRAPYSSRADLRGSRDAYVQFVQDPFDIRALVRPYVKWEYDLPSGEVAAEAVTRAHTIMQSDPMGPVYMTAAREMLAEEFELPDSHGSAKRSAVVKARGLDPDTAERIANELMAAEEPLAITGYLGRNPGACATLTELAETCALRVAEFNPTHLNISRDSPFWAGPQPQSAMDGVDLGLLLDVDVPFIPKFSPLANEIRWIHLDIDPIKRDLPMWDFPVDFGAQADCNVALRQIVEIVRAKGASDFHERTRARRARLEREAAERRKGLESASGQTGAVDAIAPEYVCWALNRRLSTKDVIVNEAIRNMINVLERIPRTAPGTYFSDGGGGLGFSGGVALGLKLAWPDRRVVQIVGDGVFHFCNPDSVYAAAARYGLPIFTVVLDNGGWQAVKESVRRVYPNGAAERVNEFYAVLGGDRQGETRRFDLVAEAFGAHGELVRDPAALDDAITRCLAALEAGRSAVMHVRIIPLSPSTQDS